MGSTFSVDGSDNEEPNVSSGHSRNPNVNAAGAASTSSRAHCDALAEDTLLRLFSMRNQCSVQHQHMDMRGLEERSANRRYRNRARIHSDGSADANANSMLLRFLHAHPIECDRKCPICKRVIPYDDFELHLAICYTTPRISYNEDTLDADVGEDCAICLEGLMAGEKIARLPCLCIFHKPCIDLWFQKKQTCPAHPGD